MKQGVKTLVHSAHEACKHGCNFSILPVSLFPPLPCHELNSTHILVFSLPHLKHMYPASNLNSRISNDGGISNPSLHYSTLLSIFRQRRVPFSSSHIPKSYSYSKNSNSLHTNTTLTSVCCIDVRVLLGRLYKSSLTLSRSFSRKSTFRTECGFQNTSSGSTSFLIRTSFSQVSFPYPRLAHSSSLTPSSAQFRYTPNSSPPSSLGGIALVKSSTNVMIVLRKGGRCEAVLALFWMTQRVLRWEKADNEGDRGGWLGSG